jgi:hypothetical protein
MLEGNLTQEDLSAGLSDKTRISPENSRRLSESSGCKKVYNFENFPKVKKIKKNKTMKILKQ